ncbi:MAG: glycoside hydrolase family 3 protein [Intrasporangium sp.]|uniref:glycoside hydrolase family 3 protein n=1 Tax=Intrasporangium sp. TaxID=1925024 RepID=UPI003F7DE009
MDTSREALRRLVAGTLMPGFAGTRLPGWIHEEYVAGLRAVCLYGANVAGPEQLLELCAELRGLGDDLVVAVDEEGGDVTRLHYRTGSPEPGNAVLGRLDDVELTRDSAVRIGAELAACGITLDLGPVVDVNSAADNPVIGVRSFGADPALVARHAAVWVAGLQSTGVAACAKHFPGHGDTVADSHLSLPVVDTARDVLETQELVPFRAAVEAGVAAVMTSHLLVRALDPDRPATFSPTILTGLLRQGLGYGGVIISDALDMVGASGQTGIPTAAVRALAAGCDLLCIGAETTHEDYLAVVDALVSAVEDGRLDADRVAQAATRARTLAQPPSKCPELSSGHHPPSGDFPTDVIGRAFEISPAAHEWLARPEPAAIVQVDTEANLAVGGVPWGPRTIGATVTLADVPATGKVAVVGRGVGPHHPARELADRLRQEGRAVLLVDCGWPTASADIVTFGGSRAVAEALVDLVTGRRETVSRR